MSDSNVPVPTTPSRFDTLIAAFAAKVGKTPAEVTTVLTTSAINDTSDESLAIVGSAVDVDDATWMEMFPGVKKPVLKNAVNTLRAAVAPPPAVPTPVIAAPVAHPAAPAVSATPFRGLVQLADDRTFLTGLTVGGRLNGTVSAADAVNAVRVGMAHSIHLFDAPEKLAEIIEEYATTMETPADDSVYTLLETIRERKYAEVLGPLNVKSSAVTEGRRKEFMSRLTTTLWPGLRRFNTALKGWHEQWVAQSANPGAMMNMIGALISGGQGLIPGMVQAPDGGALRSAHSDLLTMTNRMYSGMYMVPVARAMAFDALRIVAQLNDPNLCRAAGVPNRDELLRRLRIGVTDAYARSERSIAMYTLNALELGSQTDAELPAFAAALHMLGTTIDFDALGTEKVAGTVMEDRPARNGREVVRNKDGSRFEPFPGR